MLLTGANSLMGLEAGRFDAHAHVFTADLPMVAERRYTPSYDATPDELCSLLERFGFTGALLVQPSFLGADNSYLLQVLHRYASDMSVTFRGVAVLDPAAPPDLGALLEMDRAGIVGVRLNLVRQADRFSYADWEPVLSQAERRGWHVELHCEAEHMPRILPELVRHHGKVVIDHFGLVNPGKQNAGLQTILDQPREQLWIKISAAYRILSDGLRSDDARAMSRLTSLYLENFGADRLLWGSDWPFTQFEDRMTYPEAMAIII